jgi:DnaK suppressor protein
MLEQKNIEELKNILLEQKKELEGQLNKIAEKENGDYEASFDDFGRNAEDNAEEVEEYTAKVGVTETLEKKLSEINVALEKIENGTYGFCENCKEEIPLERLRAYPAAKDCIKCSEK